MLESNKIYKIRNSWNHYSELVEESNGWKYDKKSSNTTRDNETQIKFLMEVLKDNGRRINIIQSNAIMDWNWIDLIVKSDNEDEYFDFKRWNWSELGHIKMFMRDFIKEKRNTKGLIIFNSVKRWTKNSIFWDILVVPEEIFSKIHLEISKINKELLDKMEELKIWKLDSVLEQSMDEKRKYNNIITPSQLKSIYDVFNWKKIKVWDMELEVNVWYPDDRKTVNFLRKGRLLAESIYFVLNVESAKY